MSWSVNASGSPSEVKHALESQFNNAKSSTKDYPTENKTVELAEQIVNVTLDEMIESEFPSVTVSAFGSSTKTNTQFNSKANTAFSLHIAPSNIVP